MKDLYSCVMKGRYPPIPEFYSNDLEYVISKMLQVKPKNRPSTTQILEMDVVLRRGADFISDKRKNNKLLNTIMIPQNLDALAT